MTQQQKDRWVGALVMMAVLAVFLPVWLSNAPKIVPITKNVDASVPIRPLQPVLAYDLPLSSAPTAALQTALAARSADSSVEVGIIAKERAALPRAYVIYLASYVYKQSAQSLLKALHSAHIDAFSRKIMVADAARWRVYVGPYIQYDKVVALKNFLARQYQIQGHIKKYSV